MLAPELKVLSEAPSKPQGIGGNGGKIEYCEAILRVLVKDQFPFNVNQYNHVFLNGCKKELMIHVEID